MKLLTAAHANAKTAKNASQGNYLSYIMHLAPSTLSGRNTCPMASKGCAAACLNTAGRGQFTSIQFARIKKTKWFFDQRQSFIAQLVKDLVAVERKALKTESIPVVRLNGTSDIDWTVIKTDNGQTVFQRFPNITFYDYTKVVRRLERLSINPIPNYYLIFSKSECNDSDCDKALALGYNVATVFKNIPTEYKGRKVISGENHDLRFIEGMLGVYVGLIAKGKARKDESGFVV